MKIRYRGGPLNRQSFTGPSRQPAYRDAAGNIIEYRTGVDDAIDMRRRTDEASRRAAYFYNAQHCRYDFVATVFTETDTAVIARLLDDLREHPDQADRIEAEIRALEAGPA